MSAPTETRVPDARELGCRAMAQELGNVDLHAAAFIVLQGVRNPSALDAIEKDLERSGIGCRSTLKVLFALYRTEQYSRIPRAVAAWEWRGCEDCAVVVATTDRARCAECAELDAEAAR